MGIDEFKQDQNDKKRIKQNRINAGHTPGKRTGTVEQLIAVESERARKAQAKKEKSIFYRIKKFLGLAK